MSESNPSNTFSRRTFLKGAAAALTAGAVLNDAKDASLLFQYATRPETPFAPTQEQQKTFNTIYDQTREKLLAQDRDILYATSYQMPRDMALFTQTAARFVNNKVLNPGEVVSFNDIADLKNTSNNYPSYEQNGIGFNGTSFGVGLCFTANLMGIADLYLPNMEILSGVQHSEYNQRYKEQLTRSYKGADDIPQHLDLTINYDENPKHCADLIMRNNAAVPEQIQIQMFDNEGNEIDTATPNILKNATVLPTSVLEILLDKRDNYFFLVSGTKQGVSEAAKRTVLQRGPNTIAKLVNGKPQFVVKTNN